MVAGLAGDGFPELGKFECNHIIASSSVGRTVLDHTPLFSPACIAVPLINVPNCPLPLKWSTSLLMAFHELDVKSTRSDPSSLTSINWIPPVPDGMAR